MNVFEFLLAVWNFTAAGYGLIIGLMMGLGLVLAVFVGIASVCQHVVWPALCDFGNWLGRE